MNSKGIHWIEHTDICLVLCRTSLKPVVKRILSGFNIILFFFAFFAVDWFFLHEESRFSRNQLAHSIELIGIYLEAGIVMLEPDARQILSGNMRILTLDILL